MSTAEDEDAVRRRPRYQAVFVLGPSSSGKTTLCDALAQELQVQPPQYIKEVARSVMKTHDFTRDDTDTYEMQHAIMSAQLDAEEQATAALTTTKLNSGSVVVLSDRSAIDPIVYASTSTVPGAMDRRQRLLDDSRLQGMLAAYRSSLFGMSQSIANILQFQNVALTAPSRARTCPRMDPR